MGGIISAAKNWIPPVIASRVRHLYGQGIRYEGDFASWEEADAQCSGYDSEEILARVLAATLKVKRGEAAYERDSVLFDEVEYSWQMLASLMWVAARSGGKLNVLDFGGALGSSYFQHRTLLETLVEVRWNVVEQPHYVDAGRRYIQDQKLRFYATVEECLCENQPNIIVLSSVLQYLRSPMDIVGKLDRVGALCMFIDRTPFSAFENDKLVIQKVPAAIYSASYPMRIFSLSGLERLLGENWRKVASNISPEGYVRTSRGFDFSFQGMLLVSRE